MASSRDWNAVLLKTITSGPKAPAVLMLLEDDPQLYVVRCSEITSEVCAVFDAIEAGLWVPLQCPVAELATRFGYVRSPATMIRP